jgi:hypothetical protein
MEQIDRFASGKRKINKEIKGTFRGGCLFYAERTVIMDILDLLLKADTASFKPPEKEVKIKRLSDILGGDAVFTIKALSLDRLEEIRTSTVDNADMHAMIVLESIKSPNFKSPELKEKFGTKTPLETIKKILLAGEIEELYFAASRLSGFDRDTIEEIKKK